mmetsp:Transcript_1519/g.3254  ORF Transcript_1519/g.3254 Transcript_1519/m.3254 type:complete len:307 (-) Transcript_1519:408-1328(-)
MGDTEELPSSRLAALVFEEEIVPADIEGLDDGKTLGKGAFGEVKRVLWRKTPAAAKVAHAGMPANQKDLFKRELELMVRCRHPNVVQFLGFVDVPFVIIMEYLPMGDLRSYWRSRKLTVPHKTRICIDILRGLAYLHGRKPSSIIHRDIKPTNVLMTASGVAKITDFGLSRLKPAGASAADSSPEGTAYSGTVHITSNGDSRTNTKEVGTLPYMAPEATNTSYDEKIDIYSAAVTFYELFEQSSFEGFQWAEAPTSVRPIISGMGSAEPSKRADALALIDQFSATQPAEKLMPSMLVESSGCCVVS